MVKEINSERNDKVANLNEDFGAWEKNQKEKVEKNCLSKKLFFLGPFHKNLAHKHAISGIFMEKIRYSKTPEEERSKKP